MSKQNVESGAAGTKPSTSGTWRPLWRFRAPGGNGVSEMAITGCPGLSGLRLATRTGRTGASWVP